MKDPYRYFRIEAREIVAELTKGLLELEKSKGDHRVVARLLRHAHTLKGAARVVKAPHIADIAHAIESTLTPFRTVDDALGDARIEDLLKSVDAIGRHVTELDPPPAVSAAAAPKDDAARPTEISVDAVRVDLAELDPVLEAILETGAKLGAAQKRIDELDHVARMAKLLMDQLEAPKSEGASRVDGKASALAAELHAAIRASHRAIVGAVEQAEAELAEVRQGADRMRLVPASTLFGPLERTVADAARLLGREVRFEASGGEVRLDAHVLSAMRSVLHHVVRNAVVHGIEDAETRRSRGKAPTGRVSVRVERRGSRAAFVCDDDGGGFALDALAALAREKGLLDANAVVDVDALVRLLLTGSGLSTSATVTQMSGRGIGLDVVRDAAQRLKGDLDVQTRAGRGATISLAVPITLSSMTVLFVDSGSETVSLPLDAVEGAVQVRADGIAPTRGGESIVYREQVVPFLPIERALGGDRSTSAKVTLSPRRMRPVVVMQHGGRRVALGVARLLGTSRVVVRALPTGAEADDVVAGASIDAEGNPCIVLDPQGLIALASAANDVAPLATATRRAPILVIDDSLTTRMLEQSILESAGFEVELATSAEQGLEMARAKHYRLFLVDVEMPGMDGFQFIRETRADPALAVTPAVLVTSRGSEEDLRSGRLAGARGHIIKSEFDQRRLLDLITELTG